MPSQRTMNVFWSTNAKPQRYWLQEVLMSFFTALKEIRQRSAKARIADYEYVHNHTGAWTDVKELIRKSNEEQSSW